MVKKVLALALSLMCITGLKAQTDPVDATIDFDDILYWVGSGDNEAAFIVSYADPEVAYAWGYRFNTGATITTMINDIAAADPRLTIVGNPSYDGDILFVVAEGDTLRLSPVDPDLGYNFWWTNLNGESVANLTTTLQDGDVFKYGDFNSATGWDYQYGYYMQEAWLTEVTPVTDPFAVEMPEEATIAASQIAYWVGEGSNRVVMAVNWADAALAWGYRFNDSKTVSDMMEAIAAADPRFSYTLDSYGYLDDILFVQAAGDTLRKQAYSYWESKNNGISDMGMAQSLNDGDFEKWAEPAAGVVVDSFYYEDYNMWLYTYVYPMEIQAVSMPVGIREVASVSVQVRPNPVATVLSVSFDAMEQATEAALYDMTGRQVVVRPVAAGSDSVQLPVSQLAEGVYMLRVAGATAKVVVNR